MKAGAISEGFHQMWVFTLRILHDPSFLIPVTSLATALAPTSFTLWAKMRQDEARIINHSKPKKNRSYSNFVWNSVVRPFVLLKCLVFIANFLLANQVDVGLNSPQFCNTGIAGNVD